MLVTGGAGFVGEAVSSQLLAAGRNVLRLDVRPPREGSDGESVQVDVRDAARVDELVSQASAVVHLAAVVGVDRYLDDPAEVVSVNVEGSRVVFEACLRHDKPVLLASSSEIYGRTAEDLSESSPGTYGAPSVPRWCYAASKVTTEHLAFGLGARGLRFVITRFFNVYGPTMDQPGKGRVISKFLGQLEAGKPLELVDGGHAVRCFCYIDDAARATVGLIDALSTGDEKVRGRAFNVGRREPVTIRQLAEEMIRLSGHGAGTRDVPGGRHFGRGFEEIPRRVPNVDAAREAIGFEAKTNLRAGLTRTLEHWGLLSPNPAPPPVHRVPMVRPLFRPTTELLASLGRALESGRVTNDGPNVRKLEKEVARWLRVDRTVAVSSGSAALQIAAILLRRTHSGSKVVLPSYTFIATLNAFVNAGYEPVFCDVDPETFTLSAANVERALDAHEGVAAVVAVNAFGVPPDLEAISRATESRQARLIYDDCHGLGTEHGGSRVPGEPWLVTFSLHATKNLPAVEGGLLTGPDSDALDRAAELRNHGLTQPDPLQSTSGINAKLDELRATIALHSLGCFDQALEARRSNFLRLRRAFNQVGKDRFRPQRVPDGITSSAQNLAVRCQLPDGITLEGLVEHLGALGIEARPYFYPALSDLEPYRDRFDLPVTDAIIDTLLCFPIHSEMSESDLEQFEGAIARATEWLDQKA